MLFQVNPKKLIRSPGKEQVCKREECTAPVSEPDFTENPLGVIGEFAYLSGFTFPICKMIA